MLQILLALIAGILTIAAPCILLPLPILLGSSVGQRSRTRPLFITLGFVLTFSVLGITINFLVQHLELNPNTLRTIAVVLLAIFATFMIWPRPFELLTSHFSRLITRAAKTGQQAGTGNFGGFVMGVVIGVIWAPCAGPILGSILTLIAQESNTAKAFGLLIAYSIGAGLPMLAIAYGGQAITTKVRGIAQYSTRLQQIFGIILLGVALAVYFQYDTKIQSYLVEKLPVIGTNLEERLTNKLENVGMTNMKEEVNSNLPLSPKPVALKSLGPAPEFKDIANWLNTDHALTMKELKGKVVLIDFWTYSCINCIRTLPYVTKWYDTYKDQGFIVIGVHTPEFAFEKDAGNVARAIKQHSIHYPVAQDNNFGTWNSYNNHYWPAHYLIDKTGTIVEVHFGEGDYEETEKLIQKLLGMQGAISTVDSTFAGQPKTPEMYFGANRQEFLSNGVLGKTGTQTFVIPNRLDANKFAFEGLWDIQAEKAVLVKGPGKIKLHFNAGKVHMVASSPKEQSITAKVDGYNPTIINIKDATLYTLFDSKNYGDHILEITIPEAGFEAFTFTFG